MVLVEEEEASTNNFLPTTLLEDDLDVDMPGPRTSSTKNAAAPENAFEFTPVGVDAVGAAKANDETVAELQTLWRRFFGYHKIFVIVPVLFASLVTVLRGIGPMCTFTARELQDHVPELAQRFTKDQLSNATLGIPTDFWWAGFLDGVVGTAILGLGGYVYGNVQAVVPVQAAHKEMNSVSSMWSYLVTVFVPLILVCCAWVALLFILPRDPTGMTTARSTFGPLTPFIGAIGTAGWWQVDDWWFRRKNKIAGGSPRLMRRRSRTAAMRMSFLYGCAALWMGSANIYVANVLFPAALRKTDEFPEAVQPLLQLGVASLYFSIWLPIAVEKLWGRVFLPFILPRKKHFSPRLPRSSTARVGVSSCGGGVVDAKAVQVYAEDYYSIRGNIEKSIKRRTEMLRIVANIFFDALRFAFGRGVLSSLSPLALAVLIFKDVTYHLWHFGLRQQESLLLFTVRISHPDPWTRTRITLQSWRRISAVLFHLQKFSSISRRLAVAFEDRIDYRELMRAAVAQKQNMAGQVMQVGDPAPGEKAGAVVASDELRLHFCNQRIVLEQVPRDVLRAFFCDSANRSHGEIAIKQGKNVGSASGCWDEEHGEASQEQEQDYSSQQKVEDESSTTPTRGQNRAEGGDENDNADVRKVLSVVSAHDNADVRKVLSVVSAPNDVSEGTSCTSTPSNTRNAEEPPQPPLSLSSSAIQSATRAVTRDEMKVLRAFVRFYRQQNFIRYQIRAQTRIVVALMMLIVPLISGTGNIAYYAGFPKEGGELAAALRVSIILLAKDFVEWYVITFRVVLFDAQQVREIVPGLLRAFCDFAPTREWFLANEPGQLLSLGVLVNLMYFSFLLYNLRYNPFNLGEIQRETGFGDALSWDHIMDFCKTK